MFKNTSARSFRHNPLAGLECFQILLPKRTVCIMHPNWLRSRALFAHKVSVALAHAEVVDFDAFEMTLVAGVDDDRAATVHFHELVAHAGFAAGEPAAVEDGLAAFEDEHHVLVGGGQGVGLPGAGAQRDQAEVAGKVAS